MSQFSSVRSSLVVRAALTQREVSGRSSLMRVRVFPGQPQTDDDQDKIDASIARPVQAEAVEPPGAEIPIPYNLTDVALAVLAVVGVSPSSISPTEIFDIDDNHQFISAASSRGSESAAMLDVHVMDTAGLPGYGLANEVDNDRDMALSVWAVLGIWVGSSSPVVVSSDIPSSLPVGAVIDNEKKVAPVTHDTRAPVIDSAASASVAENTAASTVVLDVNATDNVGVVSYEFAGGADDGKFTLDGLTGELRFQAAPDFEAAASAAGSNVYSVKVRAVDGAGNAAVQSITVNVNNVNEGVTNIVLSGTSIDENVDTSTGVKIGDITLSDPDASGNNNVLSLEGADRSAFEIRTAGNVSSLYFVGSSPNYETQSSYAVTIKSSDGALVYSRDFTVNVVDLDEIPPVITSATTANVTENTPSSTVVYTVLAYDNIAVTRYSFAGGADDLKFRFGTATDGKLYFRNPPDYEARASAAGNNTYVVKVRASDAAGNSVVQEVAIQVSDVDDTAPVFISDAAVSVAENTTPSTVVLDVDATDNGGVADAGITYSKSGADAALFSLDPSTGELQFLNTPNFEAPQDMGGDNFYDVTITATDAAHNTSTQVVSIEVTNVVPSMGQAFVLWQTAQTNAAPGDINALNAYSAEIVQQRDVTSTDGSANQADPARRLTQYINQVTGTDVVSDAEFDAGFVITGKAIAGASGTISWRLDKDRTTGGDGAGAQVLVIGSNDVNHDGTADVTATYDNATGDWRLVFAPNSAALQQAAHNTYGSGVHQLLVDTDGDGTRTGTGVGAEASRLFLVASGTAEINSTDNNGNLVNNTDVAGNFSVQDPITGDVFVYYYGDPDGAGIGLLTKLDAGDSANDQSIVTTDLDGNTAYASDLDYYNTATANTNAATTPTTVSNTALHLVTDIPAQTWEFHMATKATTGTWSEANTQAINHIDFGSNTSRQASLAEAMALYAANFGENNAGGHTVGAVQPMSDVGSVNGYDPAEDNRPAGWGNDLWTAGPTPSDHALLALSLGYINGSPSVQSLNVSAVL